MGSVMGALKGAAKRRGMSVEDYIDKLEEGEKWCTGCKAWHQYTEFKEDVTRSDGLSTVCASFNNARNRAKYVPVPDEARKPYGPPRHTPRDGDKLQARHLVNIEVKRGRRPSPNDLPCAQCGHTGSDRRHEYHHHNGYSAAHHYDVIPLCSTCHHKAE